MVRASIASAKEGLELIKAFEAIKSPSRRSAIIAFAQRLLDEEKETASRAGPGDLIPPNEEAAH